MSTIIPKRAPREVLGALDNYAKSLRLMKKVDPKNRYVVLYPNWENAYVGMGFNLINTHAAEQVFARANKILDRDLLRLCLKGSRSELNSFENKSLATYVTSHALMAKLESERGEIIPLTRGAGGIGVGLINSLVFSGAMSFEDGLEFVQQQGRAMDKAASIVPTAKIIVRLRPATKKATMCRAAVEHCIKQGIHPEIAICSISRQIYSSVIELAGHEEAIKYLEEQNGHLFGFRWLRRDQKNPHASHTELMRPVKDFLRVYIEQKFRENSNYLKDPETCSVYSATSGGRLQDMISIKEDLCNYAVSTLKVESLLTNLFVRDKHVPQPNIFVLWDRQLMKNLSIINRKAFASAKLLEA